MPGEQRSLVLELLQSRVMGGAEWEEMKRGGGEAPG